MSKKKCKITLPVVMVVSAICYIYYATIFVFIDRWFGLFSSPGLMNAFVFTAIAINCIFTYAIAIVRDPGRVPSSFTPDIEDSHNSIQEVKRKGIAWSDFKSGDLRYCQKCSHYKPPRAHHCRVCKRCVLRMDHHCIWINNCVGHANYKAFFIFVLYAVIACIHSAVLLLGSIVYDTVKDEQQNEESSRTVYVVSCLLLFPLTIALGVLLGWHIYLTLRNKTTIEYCEGVRAMWLAEKGGEVYRHPYDLGAFENLTLVLGPSVFSWICPTSGHIGSGLRFPTAYDKLTESASE
ncbi:probable protein S-acyltransferase 16 isoform X1 [Chenopodium quinoa]|uniref:probable protein S-acyltransferase 16 isoform X1 n=1 Tax=Chenopodium quinoa TaxID=63459 RepID=UPI000B781088|nr:probable protein S-acyltransferase 16 isoform X1 [Chenopodium quinoa]